MQLGGCVAFSWDVRHGRSAEKCTWRWQVSLHDTRKNETDG